MTAKQKAKRMDALIDAAYRRTCSGVQVSIMDIPAIFRAGRKAIEDGADLDAAIVAFVATIRHN